MVYLGEEIDYRTQAEQYDWEQTRPAESARRDRQRPAARTLSHGLRRLKKLTRRSHGARLLGVLRRHVQGGRLCDFGCGTGRLLAEASRWFRLWGVDISAAAVARARQHLPQAELFVGPVTRVRLSAESFDAVTMQSYLEHEQQPLAALGAAQAALKRDGVVALKVPNFASWNRRLRGRNWCGYRLPDHCNYFTPKTLRAALDKSGFEILPGSVLDGLPTSDNMYLAGRKR